MPVKKTPVKKSSKAIADTQRAITRTSKVSAKQAEQARVQAAKNLKTAFKNAKQQRDSFGRFLVKLKRDARGLFVSAKAAPQPTTKKKTGKPAPVVPSKGRGKQPPLPPSPKSRKPKAPTKQTEPSKLPRDKTSTAIKSGKVYSVRNFPFSKGQSFPEWINNIDEHADEANAQLEQGEMFAGYANGYRTAVLYENIEQLTNKLNEYVDHHWNDEEEKEKFIKTLKIVKFPGDSGEYQRRRMQRMKDNSSEARKLLKVARAEFGETVREVDYIGKKKIVLDRKKTTTELLKESLASKHEQDRRIELLEANQAKLMALLEAKTAPKKKAAKKTAKKKAR